MKIGKAVLHCIGNYIIVARNAGHLDRSEISVILAGHDHPADGQSCNKYPGTCLKYPCNASVAAGVSDPPG